MLSRGGGAIAFQKVVSKVSDLPSPLDAEPDQKIVVRETEEVYGLNATTRMWEVIGTLKRVGGKKPEELAAHIDSRGNPHGTSLQDVLDVGTTVKISQEIVLDGKGPASQIRLMSGSSALRVGPDAGSKDGVLWMNVGAGKKTFLRAVNADGDDMLVLSTEGIVSGGSATFKSFKGLAEFEDEIVANEGVRGAGGYDLLLAGDKGVLFKVGGKDAALLTGEGLVLKKGLGLSINNLSLIGQVSGNLIPSKENSKLGDPKARWAEAAVGDLDVAGQLLIGVPANSTKIPFQISGAVPGDAVVLSSGGALGLGTDSPKERLDVRGSVLIEESLTLSGTGLVRDGLAVRLVDGLSVAHKGRVVFAAGVDGIDLSGNAKVEGDLVVTGKLALGGVSGLNGQSILFRDKSTLYKAGAHKFAGPIVVDTSDPVPLRVPGFSVEEGNVHVSGDINAASAALTSLTIGDTALLNNSLTTPGEFEIDAKTLVTKALRLTDGQIETNVLKIKGAGGSAEFAFNGPNCGLTFEAKHFEMSGIDKLEVGEAITESLSVAGNASFCSGKAAFNKQGLALVGDLNVGGLAFKRVVEELTLDGMSAQTNFEIPAGVRIEAVIVRLMNDVSGARFLQVGDSSDAGRFSGPTTDLKAGTLIRGLNHWNQGRAVQKTKAPVIVSGDAAATGKLVVTIHYVDPAAL